MTPPKPRDRSPALFGLCWAALAACSGGHAPAAPPADAAPIDAAPATDYHYVASQILVPTSVSQGRLYGLDLNGDGQVDNQLALVLGSLSTVADVEGAMDTAVAEGGISLLLDLRTTDFTYAPRASFQAFSGIDPAPPACNAGEIYDPITQMGCGHQLAGTASFTIDPTAAQHLPLTGVMLNNTLTAASGVLTLPLALPGSPPIALDLIGARVAGSAVSPSRIGALGTSGLVLAGAVTQDEVTTRLVPAMADAIELDVVRDCCGPGNATHPTCVYNTVPKCGCIANAQGAQIIDGFDANHDCAVSADEVLDNATFQVELVPDVKVDTATSLPCSTGATCVPAVSFGMHVTAVSAQFTVPGE